MKKLVINIAIILGIISGSMIITSFTNYGNENTITSVFSSSGPQFDGTRFKSPHGETIDFYSDKVIYHAEGAPISRRGDYKIGGTSANVAHAVGSETRYITVEIYVSERTVTLKGEFKYNTSNGNVTSLKLDGENWSRVF